MRSRKNIEDWLSTIIRAAGLLGLIYEVVGDQLKTPTALVVFGGLAGLPDVLGYRQSIKAQVEREIAAERTLLEKQHKKPHKK